MFSIGKEFTDEKAEEYLKEKKENVEKILNILSGQPYYFAKRTLSAVSSKLDDEADKWIYVHVENKKG